MKIALIQIAKIEEQPKINLKKIIKFSKEAAKKGAEIIMFPENTLTDYVRDIDKFAEEIPNGPACKEISKLAEELKVYISFGLIEKDGIHRYITQVFLGPNSFVYKYRKTWIYPTTDRIKAIRRHRNEYDHFDTGSGPEIFDIKGLKASCMICADTYSKRCLEVMKQLSPKVIFYPNNREMARPNSEWAKTAKDYNAMLLITNIVGSSWGEKCEGGCYVISKTGEVLAESNVDGKEEILIYDLNVNSI